MRASVWYEHAAPKCIAAPRASASAASQLTEQHDRSGEWVVAAAANSANIMRELNPVPFGRCRGPWRERQHASDGADDREKREAFFRSRRCL